MAALHIAALSTNRATRPTNEQTTNLAPLLKGTLGMSNRYLTVAAVAERFSVNASTIWRWQKNRDFPKPVRLGGNSTRFVESELEAWEQAQLAGR